MSDLLQGGGAGPSPAPPSPGSDDMNAALARNWWALALRGVAGIVFGLVALWVPGAVMLSLALLFAAYLLVDGAFTIVASTRAAARHERWGLLLTEGVVNIAMGIIVFMFPAGAVLGFVLLTAAWALISGALMLGAAFRLQITYGRWMLGLGGVVSIVWGVILILAPLIGALVLTWWLGIYAIVFGVVLLSLAFRLRARQRGPQGGLQHA